MGRWHGRTREGEWREGGSGREGPAFLLLLVASSYLPVHLPWSLFENEWRQIFHLGRKVFLRSRKLDFSLSQCQQVWWKKKCFRVTWKRQVVKKSTKKKFDKRQIVFCNSVLITWNIVKWLRGFFLTEKVCEEQLFWVTHCNVMLMSFASANMTFYMQLNWTWTIKQSLACVDRKNDVSRK